MTEKLKTLLDRESDVEFAAVDLDAIVAAGEKTVRRRRVAVGVASLAAAAVAVTGVALVAGGGGGRNESQVANDPDSEGMSWAVGSELHVPGATVDVGHPVRAYVATATGFVTVDPRGRVWSVVGDDVTEVGRMAPSSLSLTSDTEDSLAAWLEPVGMDWRWVVLDQAMGRRVAEVSAGRGPEITGVVVALDSRQLYVESEGYRAIDVDTGRSSMVERPPQADQLLDVEEGVAAWTAGGENGYSEYLVGPIGVGTVSIPEPHGDLGTLSPDAGWVSFDADEPRVYDAATGERVAIELDGRVFGTGYAWLDEDSLAVLASRGETGPVELLVCEVPEGTCTQVEPDLGTFDGLVEAGFALPVGTAIDD